MNALKNKIFNLLQKCKSSVESDKKMPALSDKYIDVTQSLKDTENSLRDFIALVLQKQLGNSWVEECGVSPERLDKWKERRVAEEKRQKSGVIEQRLIYYADFYDLSTILKKHWSGTFSDALGDWKKTEVWLGELEKLRDPDAHRRELLPHQKHLILGISGEIRTRLIRYRSKQETSDDYYYPKIESARDSIGNIYAYGETGSVIDTGMSLRVGDFIEFVITASDPMGEPLQYAIFNSLLTRWQDNNIIQLTITEEDIQKRFSVMLIVKSMRKYHANKKYDDTVLFSYEVLPPK